MRRPGDGWFLSAVLVVAAITLGIALRLADAGNRSAVIDVGGGVVPDVPRLEGGTNPDLLESEEADSEDEFDEDLGSRTLEEAVTLRKAGRIHAAIGVLRDGLALTPGDSVLLSELGSALITAGALGEAIQVLGLALERNPEDARSQYNLGVAKSADGDAMGALGAYREAIALRPNYERAIYNAGLVALRINDLKLAESMFTRASRVDRTARSARNWFQLGRLHARNRQPDESIADYREAIRLRPDYVEARNNLALALEERGDTEAATTELERAARLDPARASVQYNLGRLYRGTGRLEQAVERFGAAIRADPTMARAFRLYAETLEEIGQFQEAAEALEALRGLEPELAAHASRLGGLYRRLGRLDLAAERLQQAVNLDPQSAAAWSELGIVRARQGNDDAALHAYDRALRLEPDRVSTRFNQGLARERSKEYGKATASFRKVLERNPGHLVAREHLASSLLASGDLQQASEEAGKLQRLATDDADMLRTAAMIHSRSGQPALAVRALLRSLELEPENDVALFNLGVAYSKAGDYAKAIPVYEHFLERHPEHNNANRYLERARRRVNNP